MDDNIHLIYRSFYQTTIRSVVNFNGINNNPVGLRINKGANQSSYESGIFGDKGIGGKNNSLWANSIFTYGRTFKDAGDHMRSR